MKLRNFLFLAIGMALAIGSIKATAQQSSPVPPQAAPANPSAQTQATPDASHAAAVRVTTRLVQVSVVVHDRHGNPITGLTKDDFILLDDKKPQAIQLFSVRTNQPPAHPAAPLPPNTFTNRIEERGEAPSSVTMILLDALNTKFMDQAYAKQQVIKFLGQIKPQDHVALYTLGRGLHILHDFTTDSSSLLAALGKYKGQLTPVLDAATPDQVDPSLFQAANNNPNQSSDALVSFLNGGLEREAHFFLQNQVDDTVAAMIAIANHVAKLPGRKNLVWVSGSFPFSVNFDANAEGPQHERMQFSEEVAKAARALTDANVAVYPVDARGLVGLDLGIDRRSSGAGKGPPSNIQAPDHTLIDTMNDLADRTGGRAYYNSNDILGAIRHAVDDSRVTYELGYYPEDVKWDGSFHELKVKVKTPGAEVRARKGYFAIPEPQLTDKDRREIVQETAESPLDATGIGMTVQMTGANVPGAREMHTKVTVNPREIHFEQKDGRWTASIEIAYAQIDNQNQMLVADDQTIQINLTPERFAVIQKEGVVYSQYLAVAPNAAGLRVILRDTASGEVGSISIPIAQYFPVLSSKTN